VALQYQPAFMASGTPAHQSKIVACVNVVFSKNAAAGFQFASNFVLGDEMYMKCW